MHIKSSRVLAGDQLLTAVLMRRKSPWQNLSDGWKSFELEYWRLCVDLLTASMNCIETLTCSGGHAGALTSGFRILLSLLPLLLLVNHA